MFKRAVSTALSDYSITHALQEFVLLLTLLSTFLALVFTQKVNLIEM